MLKVLDTTRAEVGTITDYKDLKIERDLKTGDAQISFTYLGTDRIPAEYYVQTEDARYTIKEIKPDEDGTEYHGQLDLEALQRPPLKQFTAPKQTVTAVATSALTGTGWTVSTAFISKKSVQKFKCLPLDILYAIRDCWMAEIKFESTVMIMSRGSFRTARTGSQLKMSTRASRTWRTTSTRPRFSP